MRQKLQQNTDQQVLNKCDRLSMSNILYNMATMSFFDTIDKEAKELLPHNIFMITRCYIMVEMQQ